MRSLPVVLALTLPILLVACGSSDEEKVSSDSGIQNKPFNLTDISLLPKTDIFRFMWDSKLPDVTYTVCIKNLVDKSLQNHCNPIATGVNVHTLEASLPSLLQNYQQAFFILASDLKGNIQLSNEKYLSPESTNSAIQYFKAANSKEEYQFGEVIALSDDGNTMVVSSTFEASKASGINDYANQHDNSQKESGAVYVFNKTPTGWHQKAYLKSSNNGAGKKFGHGVAISANGKTIAVSANLDGEKLWSGAVYIFQLQGELWTQQAVLYASPSDAQDKFGSSIALSADGNRLAASAIEEDSNAPGINGDQTNNDLANSGAVYTFVRNADIWTQESYIKADDPSANAFFGTSVSLSGQGNTLAISSADQNANSLANPASVYLFRLTKQWQQIARLTASNPDSTDNFGISTALNREGTILAVGANQESSDSTGVNNEQNDLLKGSGAVYVFKETNQQWQQHAFVKASNTGELTNFGNAVAFNNEGTRLAVGAYKENSAAIGLNGETSSILKFSGAAYLFSYIDNIWRQTSYIKASNTRAITNFGSAVALSGNGDKLAVSAMNENSNATTINGDQTNYHAQYSGAVYFY